MKTVSSNNTIVKKLLQIVGFMLAIAVVHYLVSLYSIVLFREQLAYGRSPDTGWAAFLYHNTIWFPSFLYPQWPVPPGQLVIAMIPQSVLFGMLFNVPVFFFSGSWRKDGIIRVFQAFAAILLLPIMFIPFEFIMLIATLLTAHGNTFDVSSSHLPPHTEKIGWIARRVHPPGKVLDTEFHITEDFGHLGPSTGHNIIAVKVPQQDVQKWLTNDRHTFKPIAKIDFDQNSITEPTEADNRLLHMTIWQHNSHAEYFTDGQDMAIVFRKEGIIVFTIDW